MLVATRSCVVVPQRSDPATKIVPGHGSVSTPADLGRFVAMLRGVRENVRRLVEQGRSEDETVAARPPAEWDEAYSRGLMNGDTFTRFVHRSMTRRAGQESSSRDAE
jgi:hypothetical protein